VVEQLAGLGEEPVLALAQRDMQPVKPAHGVQAGVRLDPDTGAFGDRDIAASMLGQPLPDLLGAAIQRRTVPRSCGDPLEAGVADGYGSVEAPQCQRSSGGDDPVHEGLPVDLVIDERLGPVGERQAG
jgi:hypothetical protein